MIDKVILEGEEILIGTINHKERLTKEQLLLGATETFMLNEDNYVSLWCQFFWIQYTYLTHARKLYKKVQTIIKRQKKTIKDILKLDECYNFHKEIS